MPKTDVTNFVDIRSRTCDLIKPPRGDFRVFMYMYNLHETFKKGVQDEPNSRCFLTK